MSLSRKEVADIAHLARLGIDDDEIVGVTENLSRILAFVEQLGSADTHDVEPMAHPLAGMTQRLRADVARDDDRRDLYQQNAPAVESGLYLVPKVIE